MFYDNINFGTESYINLLQNMKAGDIFRVIYDNAAISKSEWVRCDRRAPGGYLTTDITNTIVNWMIENSITYPFNEEAEFQFRLTFG